MSAARYCTITLTVVISVRPKIARKQPRMATAAISSGTRASAEPNTNASTASAAAAASSVSASTPNPCLAWPPLVSSFIPVTATRLPAGSAGVIAAVICGPRLGGDSSPA
jgi:hypothetical protein